MDINKVIKSDETVKYMSRLSYAPFWLGVGVTAAANAAVLVPFWYFMSHSVLTNAVVIVMALVAAVDALMLAIGLRFLSYVKSVKLCMTDKRLIMLTGMTAMPINELPIEQVRGFNIKQTFWGKLFKYAEVGVDTNIPTAEVRVKYINNMTELNGAVGGVRAAGASCSLCGKKLSALAYKTEILDGTVCGECLKKAGFNGLPNGRSFNTVSLKLLLDRRAELINSFSPTKTVGDFMAVDENHNSFRIGKDVFEYANLLSFELLENGNTVTKGGLGRAVVGGMLFGGVGAVVGGVTGSKTQNVCSSMKLRVTLRNAHMDNTYITFIGYNTPVNSPEYSGAQKNAQACISALEIILDRVRAEVDGARQAAQYRQSERIGVSENLSAADEIAKFKRLLDDGVITQEEFEAKKKQLLGL